MLTLHYSLTASHSCSFLLILQCSLLNPHYSLLISIFSLLISLFTDHSLLITSNNSALTLHCTLPLAASHPSFLFLMYHSPLHNSHFYSLLLTSYSSLVISLSSLHKWELSAPFRYIFFALLVNPNSFQTFYPFCLVVLWWTWTNLLKFDRMIIRANSSSLNEADEIGSILFSLFTLRYLLLILDL